MILHARRPFIGPRIIITIVIFPPFALEPHALADKRSEMQGAIYRTMSGETKLVEFLPGEYL